MEAVFSAVWLAPWPRFRNALQPLTGACFCYDANVGQPWLDAEVGHCR